MSTLFQAVKNTFVRRPLLANMLSYSGMFTCAEISQQTLQHYMDGDIRKPYNWGQVGRYMVYSVMFAGPAMSIMEGREDIFAELREKFIPTYKLSCCFWIPVQCFNFLLMPPAARVVTVGVCSFVWVNILCVMKRSKLGAALEEKEAVKKTE